MKTKKWFCALILLSATGALSGCALLTKSTPIQARYFTPEVDSPPGSTLPSSPVTASDKRLRLGRIQAGPHLRERMAYRTSDEEVGYYHDRRWTERPEAYLRRALSRSLFERYGLIRAVSGAAPTLEAELVAFEEIKKPEHKVRVQIVISLDDTSVDYLEETITVERSLSEGESTDDPAPVVRALADALSFAVEEIAGKVVARLGA